MAVKSVIEVEIDDTKFKDFKSLFDDYKAALEETPDSWKDVSDEMSKMVRASELLRNDEQANLAILQQKTIEEDKAENKRRKAELEEKKRHDENIKRWKAVGSAIKESALQLTKFASIGLGIAGGASVFGFNKLANEAGNARFQSMGLGVSSGAMQSAGINYQFAVQNPLSTLASIRDAQQDLTKQKVFLTAGINNYQNKTSAQLMTELLPFAQKIAKETPRFQLAQVSSATGLNDIFSMEDLTRLGQMTKKDIDIMNQKFAQDQKHLHLNDSTLKTYQDLLIKWDDFNKGFENEWIKGLEPLAPALSKLSDSALDAFKSLMSSDKLPPLIDKMSDGITKFANYLGSGELENDFKGFMNDVDKVITQLKDFGEAAAVIVGILGASSVVNALKGLLGVGVGGAGLAGAAGVGAAGYAGYEIGGALYNNADIGIQQGIGDFVGKTAAFFGDKDAQAAMMTNENAKAPEMGVDKKHMMSNVYEAYRKAGLSDKQARTMTSQVGRENDFSENLIFGTHIDPHNKAVNLGMISMQGKRGTNLAKYMTERGLMQNGKMIHSQESIDAMAAFQLQEMKSGEYKGMDEFLANKDISQQRGSELTGRSYIKWRYDDPKYASHHTREAGYYNALNGVVGSSPTAGNGNVPQPIVIKRGDKDVNGNLIQVKSKPADQQKVKDTFALRKPTADQQKSVMFQNQQGGMYGTDNQRVQIHINNATGGNANVSALSL